METVYTSYNKCMAGSTPKCGVPHFAMHRTLSYILTIFKLGEQMNIYGAADIVRKVVVRAGEPIEKEAWDFICSYINEMIKTSDNKQSTPCQDFWHSGGIRAGLCPSCHEVA